MNASAYLLTTGEPSIQPYSVEEFHFSFHLWIVSYKMSVFFFDLLSNASTTCITYDTRDIITTLFSHSLAPLSDS